MARKLIHEGKVSHQVKTSHPESQSVSRKQARRFDLESIMTEMKNVMEALSKQRTSKNGDRKRGPLVISQSKSWEGKRMKIRGQSFRNL